MPSRRRRTNDTPHFQAALCSLSLSSSTLEYAAWASSDNSRLRTAGRHDSADNSVRFLSAATAGTDKPESPRQSITTQESDLRHPGTPGRKPGRLPLCLRQTAEEHASAPRQVRKKNAFQQGKNAAHIKKKNGSQLDFYITGIIPLTCLETFSRETREMREKISFSR